MNNQSMHNEVIWNEAYNIGVPIIDKEHKRLFKIINKLFAFGEEEKKGKWACREGIKYFKEHALEHFADEEEYMSSIHYEGLETHRYIHNEFRKNTLPALEEELESTDYSPDAVNHFIGVCAGWLIGHTLTEDLAIVRGTESKWANRLSDKEHIAIKKTIIQLLYDMFHLESHVISETYNGERFGRGVYYRLVYTSEKQEKGWEIILAFEEKLLLNTVGKIIGIKSNKLDTMLMNATRYTAQQFVGRVMKRFPSMSLGKMKEENLLTYDKFHEIFEKGNLQASLLLNTGEGYFAYCFIAPHLLENDIANPIQVDNAMNEIEKYLMEREKAESDMNTLVQINNAIPEKKPVNQKKKTENKTPIQKEDSIAKLEKAFPKEKKPEKKIENNTSTPVRKNKNREMEKSLIEQEKAEKKKNLGSKILIVDDSIVIQQSMKELLEQDYEVSIAKSGLSAIREVILDKPDLILLDYEMPICDGRQILAMLRSDEEFAHIPVIFLTSRTDQESVRKVIALKPEGYLSKYLKPAEIKEKIDDYFKTRRI